MRLSYRVGPVGLVVLGFAALALFIDAIVIAVALIGALIVLFALWRGIQWSVYGWRKYRDSRPEPYTARHYERQY